MNYYRWHVARLLGSRFRTLKCDELIIFMKISHEKILKRFQTNYWCETKRRNEKIVKQDKRWEKTVRLNKKRAFLHKFNNWIFYIIFLLKYNKSGNIIITLIIGIKHIFGVIKFVLHYMMIYWRNFVCHIECIIYVFRDYSPWLIKFLLSNI